jgi:acyl-CoA thioester hydrolase
MREGFAFSTRFRVRYSEIDGQKIVFNARYLDYADVAITEFWRWADLHDLGSEWADAEFNVVRSTVQYKQPFRFDDMVEAFVRLDRIGSSSMTLGVELCHADTGVLHAVVEIVSVHIDSAARRSKPLTETVRARLAALRA